MEQDIKQGEWIADRVLAALGGDSQTTTEGKSDLPLTKPQGLTKVVGSTKAVVTPHIPRLNALSSADMGSGHSRSMQRMQLAVPQPIKTEDGPTHMSFTSNLAQTSSAADSLSGPRGSSRSSADPAMVFRPRPTPSEQQGPLGQPGVRSWGVGVDATSPSVRQLYPRGEAMYGVQAMNCKLDSQMEATSLMPRALQTRAPTSLEDAKPITRSEPKKMVSSLRLVDLAKQPCRRCLFFHKGGDCETACLGCGTENPLEHKSTCPYRNKNRQEEPAPVPIKMEPKSFSDVCSSPGNASRDMRSRRPTLPRDMRPSLPTATPSMSATMKLSLECQRRGFNPQFQYYSIKGVDNHHQADLWIQDFLISGEGRTYKSQKDARDALASRGLERLRVLDIAASGPAAAIKPSRSISAGPLEVNAGESAQVLASRQGKTAIGAVVNLPSTIDPRAIRSVIQSAVACNPNTNISLHLPANVSLRVAEAYGRAIGEIASSSRRRSQSPMRDINKEYRTREPQTRDHERFQERGREWLREGYRERQQRAPRADRYLPSSPYSRHPLNSYRPDARAEPRLEIQSRTEPRPQIHNRSGIRPDIHARPDPRREISDFPRQRVEDSRLRLSPPPDTKYQPPYECKDHEIRGRLSRR